MIRKWEPLSKSLTPRRTFHLISLVLVYIHLHLSWNQDKMASVLHTYFQINFLVWKILSFNRNVTDICSSIGSNYYLAPNRPRVIIWTYVGPILLSHILIYWSIVVCGLTQCGQIWALISSPPCNRMLLDRKHAKCTFYYEICYWPTLPLL